MTTYVRMNVNSLYIRNMQFYNIHYTVQCAYVRTYVHVYTRVFVHKCIVFKHTYDETYVRTYVIAKVHTAQEAVAGIDTFA